MARNVTAALTIEEAFGNALAEGDGGNTSCCLSQALHESAIVEGAPRHITVETLCRVSHLCLFPILEHTVPVHLHSMASTLFDPCRRQARS